MDGSAWVKLSANGYHQHQPGDPNGTQNHWQRRYMGRPHLSGAKLWVQFGSPNIECFRFNGQNCWTTTPFTVNGRSRRKTAR